jgi:hypothetical protein
MTEQEAGILNDIVVVIRKILNATLTRSISGSEYYALLGELAMLQSRIEWSKPL